MKRVIKKKQPTKKKGVRKHLKQNSTEQVQPGSVPSVQNLRQTLTTSDKGNHLRSSLLTSMGMTSLFGMSAQQYGNINNECNIMNAQNKNQSLIEQQNSDKRTLDDLTSNNKRLGSENKELKKQLKDKKPERDKLQNKNEIAHDNLDESKRIELQMDRLTNQNQHLQVQLTETERQNKIIEYKQEKETLETELHDAIMKNQQLNKEYERNHYYQEMEKVNLRE